MNSSHYNVFIFLSPPGARIIADARFLSGFFQVFG
jgi:hypothetical protein